MPRLPTPLTLPDGGHDDGRGGERDHENTATHHDDNTPHGPGNTQGRHPGKQPRKHPGARRRGALARGESATAWAFISPSVLVILGLSVVPVLWSLLLSFQADDLVTPSRWVGLDNYRALAQDPHFSQAVGNTLLYTVLYVPLSIGLGLFLALVLNRRIRLVGFYRTLIFVPFVVSATAQGVLFSFILDPEFGAANSLLQHLGVSPQGFLTDPGQAMFVLVAISLWSGTGFCVVVLLAALQDVSPSLIEAARLDGAGRWHLLRHVTLPALTPVTVFLLLWQTINALQVFDLVYVTTKGGPLGSTTVIVYFIWEQAFKNFTAGYGAAAAYALALALLVVGGVPRLLRARANRRTEGAAR
ncbi:carbohydrate ABC transporter permease [Streptomyces sp. NRRL F-5135]|uniref:carbohydrate ABC transporter permease n=1 Tax=Streptomyces sp. NRRL F-5135 TaxID=1463858 RepID=UPI0004C8F087|nr:sugar ABC transporter permease [Streptomyces sp. NRRL F-5135]